MNSEYSLEPFNLKTSSAQIVLFQKRDACMHSQDYNQYCCQFGLMTRIAKWISIIALKKSLTPRSRRHNAGDISSQPISRCDALIQAMVGMNDDLWNCISKYKRSKASVHNHTSSMLLGGKKKGGWKCLTPLPKRLSYFPIPWSAEITTP